MKNCSTAAVAIAALIACSEQITSPAEVYLEYHARSSEGMTFEEDISYWSSANVATLEEKIMSLASRMGKSRDEAIDFYLDFSRKTSECAELVLLEERVEDAAAYLLFDSRDICQSDLGEPTTHKVKLVLEDGWKLQDVEIIMTSDSVTLKKADAE